MPIIIIPIIAILVSQSAKVIIKFFETKHFDIKEFNHYGGMPSSHTAFVTSMATIALLVDGWKSTNFAIACVLTLIVIRDAVGFRRYIGKHGEVINDIVEDLTKNKVTKIKVQELREIVGHTPLQVLIGGIAGIIIALIGYLFL